ncbi:MAG: hypothetical protein LUH11_04160 [Candidatus Gastranaerophilales bacterium]|nr:hypothetical protein [Candidatus Gastranaerophilales bacterium]
MLISEAITALQNLTSIKITQAEIARALGVDPSSVSTRIKRDGELKQSEIDKLNFHFKTSIVNKKNELLQYNDDIIADYYYEAFGSCGGGAFVLSEEKKPISIPRECFISFSKFKKYSVINAIGDSMMPYINDKDKLIVEHWQGEQILDNRVYVFCIDDNLYVKRLVDNIDQIIIKSDNEIYPIRFFDKKSDYNIKIIGQIVGLMRDMK